MNHASRKIWHNNWLLSTLALIIGVTGGCASKAPTKPGVLEAETASHEKVIHEITLTEETTQALVIIKGNQPLPYTSVKHLLPLGVVLYFPKTALEGVRETYTPENTLIKSIATTELTGRGGYSRIQINLKDDVPYKATQEKNRLLVCFKKPTPERTVSVEKAAAVPKEPTIAKPEKGTEVERGREPGAEGLKPEVPTPASAKAGQAGKPAWVNRIEFVMLDGGKSRVTIGTTNRVRYETEKPSEKKLLLKLLNTKIPKAQKRPLIATRFKSAVDLVIPIQTAKMRDTAVIAIQLREAVPYRVEQKENVLVIDLEPSTVPPRPLPDAKAPTWQQVMKEAEAEIGREAEALPEEPVLTKTGKVYTGQKISLDFQDADIRHVFRILHEISGRNFVIGDDVKGRVTLRLDNVPWDQVLDLVLDMNKLGSVEEGNVVRIAKLSTLEAENKQARATAKAEQAAKEHEPMVTAYIPINYADASSVKTHLEEIKTDRGRVTIDERTNMIIVKDIQAVIDDAKETVKTLDVVTSQVMIEARIVEAATDFSRELGILWGGTWNGTSGSDSYGFLGALGGNLAVNLPPAGPTSGIGFTFSRIGSNPMTLAASLLAMESRGRGKIISSPRILTLDNKEAYIEQGLEIPYQVLEEGSYSLKFKNASLKLQVTPHISADHRIRMELHAEKKAPDTSIVVQGSPAIDNKSARTELLVNDGDTIVIGGIITKQVTVSNSGVPGLSKIPLLGWLFRSESKTEQERELLIFVTTTIVNLEDVRPTKAMQELES
ncbi:MAG TPA: type IV pilus secretin PilQ [Desulfobacterales bacterium]|nr:type IV pilus secretin PilQ [Desulfobacterales bacterium]